MSGGSLIWGFGEMLQQMFGPLLGQWVELEVDGAAVAGEVTSVGTHHPDGPNGGSQWYLEVGGQRYTVTFEDLQRAAESAGSGGT